MKTFISKTLFFLEIFTFLSFDFFAGEINNSIMTSHGGHYEIRIYILTNISRSIYNQTIKLGQLIMSTRRNSFFEKIILIKKKMEKV